MKRVYTIGAAAAKIESQISRAPTEIDPRRDPGKRRPARRRVAHPGDIVLLAPACASFDQFQNYEHRGTVFKEVVQSLAARSTP